MNTRTTENQRIPAFCKRMRILRKFNRERALSEGMDIIPNLNDPLEFYRDRMARKFEAADRKVS